MLDNEQAIKEYYKRQYQELKGRAAAQGLTVRQYLAIKDRPKRRGKAIREYHIRGRWKRESE